MLVQIGAAAVDTDRIVYMSSQINLDAPEDDTRIYFENASSLFIPMPIDNVMTIINSALERNQK